MTGGVYAPAAGRQPVPDPTQYGRVLPVRHPPGPWPDRDAARPDAAGVPGRARSHGHQELSHPAVVLRFHQRTDLPGVGSVCRDYLQQPAAFPAHALRLVIGVLPAAVHAPWFVTVQLPDQHRTVYLVYFKPGTVRCRAPGPADPVPATDATGLF